MCSPSFMVATERLSGNAVNHMMLRQEQSIDQLPLLDQQQLLDRQQGDYLHAIVAAISSKVHERIADLSGAGQLKNELQTVEAKNGFAYRLARDAVFLIGNESMDYIRQNALVQAYALLKDHLDHIADSAVGEVHSHWLSADNRRYRPLNETYGYNRYRLSMQEGQPGRIAEGGTDFDYMNDLQAVVRERYPSDTRELFEEVRMAQYRPMRPEDAEQVSASYRKSLLTSADLALLISPRNRNPQRVFDQICQFRAKLNKGVFIWDLDSDQLREDLVHSPEKEERGLTLHGRVLESADGTLIAWATYKQMARQQNDAHKRDIISYVKNGTTGGAVEYNSSMPGADFEHDWNRIQLFQDIRALRPLASSRLAALLFDENHVTKPWLKYEMAYRLFDLTAEPEPDLWPQMRDMGLFPNENAKSYAKFRGWGFKHTGIDFNKDGPKSLRENVEGTDIFLNPKWEIMTAMYPDVVEKTRREWQMIQNAHGDFTRDDAPRNKWEIFSTKHA